MEREIRSNVARRMSGGAKLFVIRKYNTGGREHRGGEKRKPISPGHRSISTPSYTPKWGVPRHGSSSAHARATHPFTCSFPSSPSLCPGGSSFSTPYGRRRRHEQKLNKLCKRRRGRRGENRVLEHRLVRGMYREHLRTY